jgi:glycosyltransferase involved in cell wall biosynthesis
VAAALAGLRTAPVLWTAVSRLAATQLAPWLPAGTEVGVLANAVDVAPRQRTPERAADGSVRLVTTMRIARRKRPLPLLSILECLLRSVDVPVRLTVIGDGPLRPRVERHLARTGLGDHVDLTGRVPPDRVTRLLADTEVYVAPAILESFGLAALEARCVGLPVVGRSDSGMTDFVRSGVDGLLASSDAGVVEHLRRLVVDDALRHTMSEHNRTVRTSMTWGSTLEAHDAAYARVLGSRAFVVPLRTMSAS